MDTVLSEFESCWARHTETKGLLQSELIMFFPTLFDHVLL